jgi:hypothetical protein
MCALGGPVGGEGKGGGGGSVAKQTAQCSD